MSDEQGKIKFVNSGDVLLNNAKVLQDMVNHYAFNELKELEKELESLKNVLATRSPMERI